MQCSQCINGYVGSPIDNSQCYRKQDLNEISDITLPFSHASLIAVGRDLHFSNFDIVLTFAVVSGVIDVYVSTDSMAVQLVESRASAGSLRVIIRDDVTVISRPRRSVTVDEMEIGRETTPILGADIGIVKRDLQSGILSSLHDGPLYHYEVDERLTLVVPHHQPDFQRSLHYITIYSPGTSRVLFDYRQSTPRLNLYVFFSLFFCCVVLLSSMLVSSWKFLLFAVEKRQAILDRKLRERRSNRPVYSIMVYLHDGKGKVKGGEGVDSEGAAHLASPCKGKFGGDGGVGVVYGKGKVGGDDNTDVEIVDSADRDYREVDARLRSRSVLVLDGKPTYITTRPKGRGAVHIRKRKNKSKVVAFDPSELEVWPVTMQPTLDERASVHSLIVQLPSAGKSLRHAMCVGSTLVTFTAPEKKRGKSMPWTRQSRCLEVETASSEEVELETIVSVDEELELSTMGSRGAGPHSREVELDAVRFGDIGLHTREVELDTGGVELDAMGSGGVLLQSRELDAMGFSDVGLHTKEVGLGADEEGVVAGNSSRGEDGRQSAMDIEMEIMGAPVVIAASTSSEDDIEITEL